MRVSVNLTWIAPGRVGGSEEYLVRQLLGLAEPSGVEIVATRSFHVAHPELAERFDTVESPIDRDNRALRIVTEHTWMAARTRHANLVHHGGGTAPLVGRRPVVLTIHDLQYLSLPGYFSAARRHYLERIVPRSVRDAAVVAVPSEFVRASVVDAFGADPGRVVVVPHGIPHHALPDPDAIAEARARWGVADRPYVLYPAISHPHKHHEVLIGMLDHLDDGTALVLVGGTGRGETGLVTAIGRSRARDRVVRTGRVSHADRDALLAGADALVFPSEYEGFGAPLVEAMALGVPVVAFGHPAIREVVGDAGVIVETSSGDPSVGEAWAEAVVEARRRRRELIGRGRERRTLFTTATSGAALDDAYRLAIEIGATP